MHKTIAALLVAGSALVAGVVSAAPLSIEGGPTGITPTSLPDNFGFLRDVNGNFNQATRQDPIFGGLFDANGDLNLALPLTTFNSTNIAGNGLAIDPARRVKVTYLGFEATNENTADATVAIAGSAFNTTTSVLGDTFSFKPAAGSPPVLLPLSFTSTGKGGNTQTAVNGVSMSDGLLLSFAPIFNNGRSALVLLGDIDNDLDVDDIVVRVDVVPLPAAIWMFGAALGGMGLLSRRRSRAVAA